MGSSSKKKKEKKADFQKAKLKVGKARPKNTNATSTDFTAKSIVLKQQNLSEGDKDRAALFHHNLSLLESKNETQRRDALIFLIAAVAASNGNLPKPPSEVLAKAQTLFVDGSASVRTQALKLVKLLPSNELGGLEKTLLHQRLGMTHLSNDIKLFSLDVLDWLCDSNGPQVVSLAGGWVKTLKIFQQQLSWQTSSMTDQAATGGSWSATKAKTNLGSNKLLVHQLTTLAHFLTVGLTSAPQDPNAEGRRAAALFPLWHTDFHLISKKSNPFGYLNLFGKPRDVESEEYSDAEERAGVMVELRLHKAFEAGVREAKREGGEVGRAASAVEKALRLVNTS